jgi:hypothetical protein
MKLKQYTDIIKWYWLILIFIYHYVRIE